jgi:thiamine pyrophosphokinase
MGTAIVFVGGPHRAVQPGGHPGLVGVDAELVVAVDSGLHAAEAHGWSVHLVVGDMDSVDPGRLAAAEAAGAERAQYDRDKDATDLELALDTVVERGMDRAVVVAADGGRMDHLLGSVLTLCAPRYASLRIEAWLGGATVVPVRDRARFEGSVGTPLSILPVHGAAVVRTEGLRWPLHGERLEAGTSRGLSNEMVAEVAEVSVDEGCVAVVRPEEER